MFFLVCFRIRLESLYEYKYRYLISKRINNNNNNNNNNNRSPLSFSNFLWLVTISFKTYTTGQSCLLNHFTFQFLKSCWCLSNHLTLFINLHISNNSINLLFYLAKNLCYSIAINNTTSTLVSVISNNHNKSMQFIHIIKLSF